MATVTTYFTVTCSSCEQRFSIVVPMDAVEDLIKDPTGFLCPTCALAHFADDLEFPFKDIPFDLDDDDDEEAITQFNPCADCENGSCPDCDFLPF